MLRIRIKVIHVGHIFPQPTGERVAYLGCYSAKFI